MPVSLFPDSPSPAQPLDISWSAKSVSGTKKPTNEDAWLAFAANTEHSLHLEHEGTHSLESHDLIFAVSDGMGGCHAGDVASELILHQLSEYIPKTLKIAAEGFHPDYLTYLTDAIQSASTKLNEIAAADPEKKGMGATLALAWFTPENLYLCNIGDSRLYIHRAADGETQQLSEDHTFAWKGMKRGDISEREYRNHPRRAALYEAIGGGHQKLHPYLAAVPYEAGDQFLICSDGLIDGLWDKHIHSAFSQKTGDLAELRDSLIARAIANDGSDDTTAIVIQVAAVS